MEVSMIQYPPGDSRMIDTIVHQLKSQGIFDQFRKECIADVDTKPAYQNLHQRVEGTVSGFLSHQKWRPDLNKNQLRESLRKHIHDSGFLDIGVERIVDQVVNPKIMTVLVPQVEDVVYKFLGIEKPRKNPESQTPSFNFHNIHDSLDKRKDASLRDLLPKDLDPVSPESDEMKKSDQSVEDGELDEDKGLDDEESPPFEALADINDNSVESHLSGISGLTSPDSADHHSNLSFAGARTPPPQTNDNDSQLSKVSSGSRLSISFGDEKSPVKAASPMDIDSSEGSSSSDSSLSSIEKISAKLGVTNVSKVEEKEKVSSSSTSSSESSATTGSDESLSPITVVKPEILSPITEIKSETFSPKSVSKPKKDVVDAEKTSPPEVARKDHDKRTKNDVEIEKSSKKEKEPVKSTKKYDEKVKQDKEERKVILKKVHDEEKSVKKDREEKKVIKKDKEVDKLVKKERKEVSLMKEEDKKVEKEELKKKDRSQSKEIVKKVEKESKDREIKKSDKHKSLKKDDHRSIKPEESKSDKVVKKEEVKVSKSGKKDEKDEHTTKKDEHTTKKDEHTTKKDEHTSKKDEHTVKKDEHTSKKDEHTSKKDEHTVKKEEHTSKKDEHTVKKEEHTTKRDEHTVKKEEHTVKKEEHTVKKDEKTKTHEVKKDGNSRSSSSHKSDKDKDKHHNSKSSRHDESGKTKSSEKHVSKDDKNKTNGNSKVESKEKSSKSSDKSLKDREKKSSKEITAKSDKEKYQSKSSSDKEKDSKRKDKSKLVNDHDKHREKRPDDRRSTDRDSNGTTRDRSASSSQTTTSSKDAQRHENKDGKKGTKSNGGGTTESSEVHQEPKSKSTDQVKSASRKRPNDTDATTNGEEAGLKIKMPKIANNIYEVQKIIRLRKSLAKRELKRQQDLLDSQDSLPIEVGEDVPEGEGFKYFEPYHNEEKEKFVSYIKRISRSRRLSELSVSSVEENDVEIFIVSKLPDEDYIHHNLPVPSIEYMTNPKEAAVASTSAEKQQKPKVQRLTVPKSKKPLTLEEVVLPTVIPAAEELNSSVEAAKAEDSQASEMKPPDTISPHSRENRRSRKPNTKYSSEDYSFVTDDLDMILPPEKKSPSSLHKRNAQHAKIGLKRLKVDLGEKVQVENNCARAYDDSVDNNNKDENTVNNEMNAAVKVVVKKTKTKLGPSRRIGLTRPKNATTREIVRVSTPDFVMPLSPESDVSASSSELAKKTLQEPSPSTSEEEIVPVVVSPEVKKIQRRSSALTTKGQRYTSDDLYKPRPLFNRMTRRTRGASPMADEVAESTKHSIVLPQRKR